MRFQRNVKCLDQFGYKSYTNVFLNITSMFGMDLIVLRLGRDQFVIKSTAVMIV